MIHFRGGPRPSRDYLPYVSNYSLVSETVNKIFTSDMKIWIQEVIQQAAFEALKEARLDDLKAQYPQIAQKLDKVANLVPFKYLPWVSKQLAAGAHDLESLASLVKEFDLLAATNVLRQKDINTYKEPAALKAAVDAHKGMKSGREERRLAKHDTKPLYNDGRFLAFQPLSKDAACYYGYGTKWCISGKEYNLYDLYVGLGAKFIFVFDKNPPSPELEKLVFAFGHDGAAIEWFNALNQTKPNVDYLPVELATLIAKQSPNSGFARDLQARLKGK